MFKHKKIYIYSKINIKTLSYFNCCFYYVYNPPYVNTLFKTYLTLSTIGLNISPCPIKALKMIFFIVDKKTKKTSVAFLLFIIKPKTQVVELS